ncbi:hypothetical protein Tco_0950240, partial [Tanacetum coccineum]
MLTSSICLSLTSCHRDIWTSEKNVFELRVQRYSPLRKVVVLLAMRALNGISTTHIMHDMYPSHDDEEDTRDSQEYLNDLEEEFQERALLAKSKRFFKKGSPRFNSAKATDEALIPLVGPVECDIRRETFRFSFSEQIDIVQLGIVSQDKLKLLLRISGVKYHEVRILLAFDACGCKGRDTKENTWRSLSGSTSYVDSKPRKSSSPIIENNSLK